MLSTQIQTYKKIEAKTTAVTMKVKGPVYIISCDIPLKVRSTCLPSVPTSI